MYIYIICKFVYVRCICNMYTYNVHIARGRKEHIYVIGICRIYITRDSVCESICACVRERCVREWSGRVYCNTSRQHTPCISFSYVNTHSDTNTATYYCNTHCNTSQQLTLCMSCSYVYAHPDTNTATHCCNTHCNTWRQHTLCISSSYVSNKHWNTLLQHTLQHTTSTHTATHYCKTLLQHITAAHTLHFKFMCPTNTATHYCNTHCNTLLQHTLQHVTAAHTLHIKFICIRHTLHFM